MWSGLGLGPVSGLLFVAWRGGLGSVCFVDKLAVSGGLGPIRFQCLRPVYSARLLSDMH
jgi:hypothetical protein